jgi:soluble lytic murein transglycosylase
VFAGGHQSAFAPLPHALASDPSLDESAFDPDLVRPVSDSPLAQSVEARRAGDLERARTIALSGLTGAALEEGFLLRWLAAHATRELDAPREAALLLQPLAESEHPLSSWARLYAAEWLEVADPQLGLKLIAPLIAGSSDLEHWPGEATARRTYARLLAQAGKREDAIVELERLVASTRDEVAAVPIALPLGELLAERSDEPSRARAYRLLRSIAYRVPGSRAGSRAETRAQEVLRQLSPALRARLREPLADDKLARADGLVAAQRYVEAEDAYVALEQELEDDPARFCRARYGRAKVLLDRRSRDAGSQLMADVAERCRHDVEQRAWARFYAARAFSALGQNELALSHYEALEREAPAHRLADDALFRAAKVARDMGDSSGLYARLSVLPDRYPEGDMRARARFQLAWQAAAEHDLPLAVAELTRARRESEEQSEDSQGRAAYWRARFLGELNRRREAIEAYTELASLWPLTYYGQLAISRLQTLEPERVRKLTAGLRRVGTKSLRFERRAELEQPGFLRALSLLRVGETALALSELRESGFLREDGELELYLLSVSLFDRAGSPETALDLARKRMPELLRRFPIGRDRDLLALAYPQAFAPLIEQVAEQSGVPSSFLRAVAREESGFHTTALSRAGARGLIQILPATAKEIAKGMGMRYDRETLSRPEVNLALGARFMATLSERMGGQLALVPAAYNAGPSITSRWLNERKSEPLDVWIENIPYDETRQYSRRVIQSYGVYAWLESGELPILPIELPGR